jgi:galacturan 1,4-alpha-galacturonidase
LHNLSGFASGENCVLRARDDAGDDTTALLDAFKRCGQNGTISLPDPVYHINQIMNTTNLKNCRIDLKGKLLVGISNKKEDCTYQNSSGARISTIG